MRGTKPAWFQTRHDLLQTTLYVTHATRAPFFSDRLPQRPERCSELGTEKFRLLPRREVSALVDFVEVGQVGKGAPGPSFGGAIDLLRKYRDGHGKRYLGGLQRHRGQD